MDKVLYRLWSVIDISDNIKRVKNLVTRYHTKGELVGCLVGALIFFCTSFTFAAYCDFLPTYFQVQKWSGSLVESLNILIAAVNAGFVLPVSFVGFLGLLMTIFPTAAETFGIQYSMAGISVFTLLFYAMSLFDFATDNPVARDFIAKYDFTPLGWFAPFATKIFHILWLFMSTYGFEAIAMVSGAAIFYSLRALVQEIVRSNKHSNKAQAHNNNAPHNNMPRPQPVHQNNKHNNNKPRPVPQYEAAYRAGAAFAIDRNQIVDNDNPYRPAGM